MSDTCRRYNNSIQCKAFADYVFKTYIGRNCTASNSTTDYDISESEWSTAKVKSTLRGISKGSNIRGYLSSGYHHSIIVLSTDSSGIKYYHANKDHHCLVAVDTKTWAEFADYFSSIYDVWVA